MAATTKACRLEARIYAVSERVAEHYGTTIGAAVRMLILSPEVRKQFLTSEELAENQRAASTPQPQRMNFFPRASGVFGSANRNQGKKVQINVQAGVRL